MYLPRFNASRVLHRLLTGVCSDDAWLHTRLVGTVVLCRRQPEKVHAHKRLEGVASGQKSSYQTLYLRHQSSLRSKHVEVQHVHIAAHRTPE